MVATHFCNAIVTASHHFESNPAAVFISHPSGEFHVATLLLHLSENQLVLFDRTDVILVPVQHPERNVFDQGNIHEVFRCFQAIASRRCRSCEIVRIQLCQNIGAMSAHGMPENIDAIHTHRWQFCDTVSFQKCALGADR